MFPNNKAISLFGLIQETQSEQCLCNKKKQMSIVFIWARDMRAFFGLDDADVFHCMLWCFISGLY
jgi:hypothetical protein